MRRIIIIGMLLGIVLIAACSKDDKSSKNAKAENEAAQVDDTQTNRDFADYQDELLALPFDPIEPLADFTLDSTTGEPFSLEAQRGKISLYYFGFMNCPDICPTTLAQLKQAYMELGEPAEQLAIYFVTIDPERDSLDNMAEFMTLWHDDFVGLYGEGDNLEAAKDEFGVFATKREVPNSAVGYLMDHTGDVYIVDTDGNLVARFIHGVTASTIVHDLSIMLENDF